MKYILIIATVFFLGIQAYAQAPVISVEPDSLSEDLLSGKISEQTLTIYNNGGSDLTFEINVKDNLELLLLNSTGNHSIASSTQPLESTDMPIKDYKSYSGNSLSPDKSFLFEKNGKIYEENSLVGGLKILLITSGGYPSEIKDALLSFPDIQQVDIFDAYSATPTLNEILPYHTIIAMNNTAYADPVAMGNVLADYVDAERGLIITVATFASGWEIKGRLLDDGYFPFNIGYGPIGAATLGTFNPDHPIMQGVTTAYGDLLADVTVASGAELVASWNTGWPFVATKGKNVAAINIYVTESGFWAGDIPLILHNAAFWAGRCAWLSAEPDSGTIPAGSSLNITMKFNAAGLIGGEYNADIKIINNDPVTPELIVPAHLSVTDAPAISTETNSIDFGEIFLGVSDTFYLEVKNIGSQDLLIFNAAIQPSEYTIYPTFAGIDPGEKEMFTISFLPTQVGSYPGTLTLTSNDPLYGNYVINLSGQGVEPPVIIVYPDSIVVGVLPGSTRTKTLTVSNVGESNLYFNIAGGFSSTNYALQFDGVDDMVKGPTNAFPVGIYNRTIEMWFRRISQPVEEGTLIGYGGWGSDGGAYFIGTHQINWWFSQWGQHLDANTIMQDNQWYHIAIVTVGNEIFLYTNGEIDGAGNLNFSTYSDTSYYIGKAPPEHDWNRKFHGIIDEIRLWNVERSQNEIQENMYKQLTGAEPGLIGYWQFNEGTGDITLDKTVNANHGSLFSGVQWTDNSAPLMPGWFQMNTDSGVCSPHSSMNIELLFDATELDTGDYYASIIINSNDPVTPTVIVPIHMIVSTSVGVEDELNTPLDFNLAQNYPNPFNPSTTIKYSIPKTSKVQLKLFNLLGEVVITLVNEEKNAGNYSVGFDAASLPSGVYFYQLKASDYVSTKKMLLLK